MDLTLSDQIEQSLQIAKEILISRHANLDVHLEFDLSQQIWLHELPTHENIARYLYEQLKCCYLAYETVAQDELIIVYYHLAIKKPNIVDICNTIISKCSSSEHSHSHSNITICIVLKDMPNDTAWNVADSIYNNTNKQVYVQLLYIKTILFNVMQHVLVPKHERVNETDFTALKEYYALQNKHDLPIISHKDPVALFIGLRPGDVCRVIRNSETAGESYTYRYCR